MSRTMYEITRELDELRDKAYEYAGDHDGELPDYMSDFLDSLEGEKEDKAINIACAYKEIDGFIHNIKVEEKRLKQLKSVYINEMNRIKEYLSLFITPGEKIKTDRATISWRKSSVLELNLDSDEVNFDEIPDEFKKIDINFRKDALKSAIKDGDEVAMNIATIVEKQNIQLK